MEDKPVAELVDEYLRLGGTRRSANDDNKTSTRKWQPEPPGAKSYWDENMAILDSERQEVETLLPSVSTDA